MALGHSTQPRERCRAQAVPGARTRLLAGTPRLLELLEGPGPVVPEQPRQGTIRRQAPAGLAARAVVGLGVGVDDALDRRAAVRAGLAPAAVDRHTRAECGHVLREAARARGAQPLGPHRQRAL